MNTTSYSDTQFDDTNTQLLADRQKGLAEDAAMKTAYQKLERAQGELQSLSAYVGTLPLQRRLEFNGNMATAKEAVNAAQKELQTARNDFYRRDRLARLEEQQSARTKERDALQAAHAQEAEAEAKQQMKQHYLMSGGTAQAFEAAWPDMWARELQERAAAQLAGARRRLEMEHGYAL